MCYNEVKSVKRGKPMGFKSVAKKAGKATVEGAKKGAKFAGKKTAQVAKDTAKHTAKNVAKNTAQSTQLGEEAVKAYDTAKNIKKKGKMVFDLGKTGAKLLSASKGAITWLVSNPLGWMVLVFILASGAAMSNALKDIGNAKVTPQEQQAPTIMGPIKEANNEAERSKKVTDYILLMANCDKPGSNYHVGEMGDGNAPGSWEQEGTAANARARYLFETLVSFGLPNAAAAAAIGNGLVESAGTFHPGIVETAYTHMYNPVELLSDIGGYISPSANANTSSPSAHGTAGYGIFQESPGILLSTQSGKYGWTYAEPFGGTGPGWQDAVRDKEKVATGIFNEVEYFLLTKSGAGMSATGYVGLKEAAANRAHVTRSLDGQVHDIFDDVLNQKDVAKATAGWFWFFELGDLRLFSDIVGAQRRIKAAEKAYEMFRVEGRDDFDQELLNKAGSGSADFTAAKKQKCKKDAIDRSDIVKVALSLVGFWSYSQPNRDSVIPTLDNPQKGVGQTDCSGFVWSVYKMAGYKVPEYMYTTMTMYSDAYGPGEYLELIPESQAKAGDAIVHDPGGSGAYPAHTGILMEDWRGPDTPIVQEGGGEGNVNAGHPASASIASPYFFVRPKHKAK